jgi:putative hydrolase of the HAD superfamily
MRIKALFFDLDGTLYPHGVGIWNAISVKMNEFMHQKLSIPFDQVSTIREEFFKKYGTTLRGIQNNYDINPEEYLNYVHDVPVKDFLKQDIELQEIMKTDDTPKWILTNSDKNHSKRVMDALGISEFFEGIIDVWSTDFKPKPEEVFFETALNITVATNPGSIIFFDDIAHNVLGAQNFGFNSVHVGNGIIPDGIKYHIERIHDYKKILVELNNSNE